MKKVLEKEDLFSLERYAVIRAEFRSKVMQHKKNRRLPVGPHATLYFEDSLTIQYQIQEMLRIERIFEEEKIQEELDVYNPLVPDGCNLKATFMIEYEDVDERRQALTKLIGIEKSIWIKVGQMERVTPLANEDLDYTKQYKTSSVHFLRFELKPAMAQALKAENAALSVGIEHPLYQHQIVSIPAHIRDSLATDLDLPTP